MSQQAGILEITFIAGADLRTKQYRIVKLSGTPQEVIMPTDAAHSAAQTEVLIGILQNEPNIHEAAVVRVEGTSKLVVSTPMAEGDKVTSATPGGTGGLAATAADFVIGHVLEQAAAANDIVEVLIDKYTRV